MSTNCRFGTLLTYKVIGIYLSSLQSSESLSKGLDHLHPSSAPPCQSHDHKRLLSLLIASCQPKSFYILYLINAFELDVLQHIRPDLVLFLLYKFFSETSPLRGY